MMSSNNGTSHHQFAALAAEAIAEFVTGHRVLPIPDPIPREMTDTAGVFVSIKKASQLRGCIGTFLPTQETLAQEIIANAIKSATEDPRFPPVSPAELPDLEVSVDVLSEPEPCTTEDLDPARFGVLVEAGWKRGLLLPDLEGVDTAADQLAIAKRKAGLSADEPYRLLRFTVSRFH